MYWRELLESRSLNSAQTVREFFVELYPGLKEEDIDDLHREFLQHCSEVGEEVLV